MCKCAEMEKQDRRTVAVSVSMPGTLHQLSYCWWTGVNRHPVVYVCVGLCVHDLCTGMYVNKMCHVFVKVVDNAMFLIQSKW